MELLIILIIVIVFCFILNISLSWVALGLIALMGLISALFTLAFLGCVICLLGCRKKEATFLRTDNVKGSKFQVAYYMIGERECPCIFPKEAVLEDKLYRTDKVYHVMLHEKSGRVYDRFAVTTCLLGFVAGTALSVGIMFYFLS